MSTPRFTIIIPTYNGQDYIQSCVESMLHQTFSDFELTFLDDCSTDNTLSILKSYSDKRVKIIESDVNLGIAKNWRRALSLSKGEFMTYFGQDDGMLPHYLEVIDNLIRREPEASIYHAHFQYVDIEGKVLSHSRAMPTRENTGEYLKALFSGNRDTHGSGYMMRSDLYDKIGGIPPYPNLFFADDVLWITAMRHSYKACAADICFFCGRHNNLSIQPRHWNSWLNAMEEYIDFLLKLGEEDADIGRALQEEAGNYFSAFVHMIYLNALHSATLANQCIDPAIEQKIRHMLVPYPQALKPLNQWDVQIRKQINTNSALRNSFLLYKRLLHR